MMLSESLQLLMANLRAFGVAVAVLDDLKAWKWHGVADTDWKETVYRAWCDALRIEPPPENEITGHQEGLFYWQNSRLGGRELVSFYWADIAESSSRKDWKKLKKKSATQI
jgi:hypothetical protein